MKANWEFKDYMIVGLIILFIFSYCYSCARDAEKASDEAIEAAYTEGYEQDYYDGENGNPYKNVR
jgi:hypothetical protein